MGGRVFAAIGRESVRLPTSEMAPIAQAAAGATGGSVVRWLTGKTDHGDADVVVPDSCRRDDALAAAAVGAATGLPHLHYRDNKENPILFVGVETPTGLFQIDLIHWPDRTADFCRRFLSWGDAGSMVGMVAREMGLKFGMDGLKLPVRVQDAPLGSVLLTADFDEALDLLGLDPAAHATGFADDAETAAWIGSGRYHDPKLYDPSRSSSDARRRGRARKGRDQHLALLRSFPASFEWPQTKGDSLLQRAFVEAAVDRFGKGDEVAAEKVRISGLKRNQTPEVFSMDFVGSIHGGPVRDTRALITIMRETWFTEAYSFSRWKETADADEIRTMVTKALTILKDRRDRQAERAERHAQHVVNSARKRAAGEESRED